MDCIVLLDNENRLTVAKVGPNLVRANVSWPWASYS